MYTRRAMLAATLALPLAPASFGDRLLPFATRLSLAARRQIGITRFYDPAYVRDPREIGLISEDGVQLVPSLSADDLPPDAPDGPPVPDAVTRPEPVVQTPESENMR